MTKTANPMKAVYERLAEAGFTKTYVRKTVLPSWWDDAAAENPAGFAEAIMILSRHLGLEPRAIRSGDIHLSSGADVKFKKTGSTTDEELVVAERLVAQVARLVVEGVVSEQKAVPSSAATIREAILRAGKPWVGFDSLLDFCWSVGIPVVCVTDFPPGAKKMQGFALKVGNRPVIGICSERSHPSWLLFVLAHELGHVARGHVQQDGVLVDEKVDEDSDDGEETEANAFAHELLTGAANVRSPLGERIMRGETLAEKARMAGYRYHVDPGHLVLRYAHVKGRPGRSFFPVAQKALAILDREPNGLGDLRERLAKNLDWESLPPEARAFVGRVTETPIPASA